MGPARAVTPIFVPYWHKCEWSLEVLWGSPLWVSAEGHSVGIAFGAPTQTRCSPITLDFPRRAHSFLFIGAVILKQSGACPFAGATEPANGHTFSIGSPNRFFSRSLQFLSGKVLSLTEYGGEKAQSLSAMLASLSQRKQHWELKGDLGRLFQLGVGNKHKCTESMNLSLCV